MTHWTFSAAGIDYPHGWPDKKKATDSKGTEDKTILFFLMLFSQSDLIHTGSLYTTVLFLSSVQY